MKFIYTLLIVIITFNVSLSQNIELELFVDGLDRPINLQHAGDERLFVVEQSGIIKIIYPDGTTNPVPFLDLSDMVTGDFEQGLLGLAFHPNYSTNGYFYVNYSDLNGSNQISRYSVDPTNNNLANPSSELPLILIEQPSLAHNGGCLAFGPDNYLYISSGDGGPSINGQILTTMLGKLLRIDVDNPAGGNNYGIPPDNPFAGSSVYLEEIWAYGLRNPWKFSFDTVGGNIWIGDVGASSWEEINKAGINEAGLNYGWRCWEGNHPGNTSGSCPSANEVTFPVAEYPHNGVECSVTGGYVYRGSVYNDIQSVYFFADYCSGLLGTIDSDNNVVYHGNPIYSVGSFGADMHGELYILDSSASGNGKIFKIKGDALSVEDFQSETPFTLTPNPASEVVVLRSKNEPIKSISVYDLKGVALLSEENVNTSEISITTERLQNGIYLVQIETETGELHNSKLIIE